MHELSTSSASPMSEVPSAPPTAHARVRKGAGVLLDDIDLPAAILDENGIVREVNGPWAASPIEGVPVGRVYLDGLRAIAWDEIDAIEAIAQVLKNPREPASDVRERTLECHNTDNEHWFTVSLSTVVLGGRTLWLVIHQNLTALRQLERRCRLIRQLAASKAISQDPTRQQRLAITVGEVLQAASVVLWERAASGALRARPLETGGASAQVSSIAHTRQMVGVMDVSSAQWIRLIDGTPCFAVPLKAREQVVLFHFPRRPRLDADTLRVVARALQSDPSLREQARAGRSRSPREIRRQMSRQVNAAMPSLAVQEREHIERTLARCGNNVLRTAQALGIARSTLYERIKDYGITVPPRTA